MQRVHDVVLSSHVFDTCLLPFAPAALAAALVVAAAFVFAGFA